MAFDYELYEREVGFLLQLECWQRKTGERFETEMALADLGATATLSVISERGKRILTNETAMIAPSPLLHVFQYALTTDDFLIVLRGNYRVWWRCVIGGQDFKFERTMLVKPSAI